MSGKSNLLVNESPITRNALLAHSRFDNALFDIGSVQSTSPFRRRCRSFRLRKGCKNPPTAISSISIYPTHLFLTTLSTPHLILLFCFPRQHGQFCVRELCNRFLSYNSSRWLSSDVYPPLSLFLSLSLSLSLPLSLSTSSIKRPYAREENIRRQRANIQSLISEIARNRSRQGQF